MRCQTLHLQVDKGNAIGRDNHFFGLWWFKYQNRVL